MKENNKSEGKKREGFWSDAQKGVEKNIFCLRFDGFSYSSDCEIELSGRLRPS